jgi:integrase
MEIAQKNVKLSFENNSNQYYKNFINSCKSEATKNYYRSSLGYFMKYLQIEPEDDYSKLIDGRDAKIIAADIIDWIIHLKDIEKKSPASINLYIAAVKHFYMINDVILNTKRINAFKPEFRNVVEDKPYTREQIKILLDKAEQRNRAIILLLSSSGMRVGALPNLRIGDLTPVDKYNIYQIQVYRRSSKKSRYVTFCTPECRKEIDTYLEYRKRYGERITENSPLFRTTFNHGDQLKAAYKIKPLCTSAIKHIINELLNVTGVRPSRKMNQAEGQLWPQHNYNRHTNLMQLHGFRKFFYTTCTTSGLSTLYTEMLMGHDTGLKERYTKLTPEDLLEGNDKNVGYVDAIYYLTINEENKLKRQVETLRIEKSKIDELSMEMEKLKKALNNDN